MWYLDDCSFQHGHLRFSAVRGQMQHRPGAWISHQALGGNVHCGPPSLPRTLVVPCLCAAHTSLLPFSELTAAPHWSARAWMWVCLWVRACDTAHARDRQQKQGKCDGDMPSKHPSSAPRDVRSRRHSTKRFVRLHTPMPCAQGVCILPTGDDGSFAAGYFPLRAAARLFASPAP